MAAKPNPKPILFQPPMVRAILDGRKTQTRRVVKSDKPRYQPGDVLWVRETFSELGFGVGIVYRADKPSTPAPTGSKWRPSIHMPYEAARLFLRVLAVRQERLQDITPKDCCAEGITKVWTKKGMEWLADMLVISEYSWLWDDINAKRYSWHDNPLVWVITFERCERPDEVKL